MLPISACEEVVHTTQRKTAPSSQAASAILETSRQDFSICSPIDELLGNHGLKPGTVLEISGPPGAPKELCILRLMGSVIREKKEVYCIGESSPRMCRNIVYHSK